MRRAFVVQQSFREPRATTNPYIVQLLGSLRSLPDVEVRTFGWSRALFGRYDVFHAHWPEILVSGRRRSATTLRTLLFLLLLVRLRLTRTAYVRTVHNVELPGGLTRWQRFALQVAERQTALRIVLSAHTPVPAGAPTALVPHGDYRTWFEKYPRSESEPGRMLFFGQVRNYKGVPALLAAYRELAPTVSATLTIAGRPTSQTLAEQLRDAAGDDPRIRLRFEHVSDGDLVEEISRAQLVVLPYPNMHNSGSALAALSLDRAVLVPGNAVNAALAEEAGDGWVHCFDGVLRAEDLARAVTQAPTGNAGEPDLSRRDWSQAGEQHLAAYRRADSIGRGRGTT